jgi:Ran GTPase-activating protein (RanGAP) involved in mRNA processing and transport
MSRPRTLEVADKLRSLKLFESELNNIDVKKWENKHIDEWDCIMSGKVYDPVVNEKLRNKKNSIQVLRVSDGKIYESITQCINHNGFYKDEMTDLLKKGKEYKKIVRL